MPPSPSKSKVFHKSSGKLFRHKDKDRSSGNATSNANGNLTNNGVGVNGGQVSNGGCTNIRKDEVIDMRDCPLTLPDVSPLDHTKSLLRYYGCKYLTIFIS